MDPQKVKVHINYFYALIYWLVASIIFFIFLCFDNVITLPHPNPITDINDINFNGGYYVDSAPLVLIKNLFTKNN